MIHRLTNTEYQILLAIGNYHDATGHNPSVKDLRELTGYANVTLYEWLPRLKQQGYITYDCNRRGHMKSRSIQFAEVTS